MRVAQQLGLFAVAHLAERHGITVVLSRAPGGGTTAEVWLPPEIISPDAAQAAGTAALGGDYGRGSGAVTMAPDTQPWAARIAAAPKFADGVSAEETPDVRTPDGADGRPDGHPLSPSAAGPAADAPAPAADAPGPAAGELAATADGPGLAADAQVLAADPQVLAADAPVPAPVPVLPDAPQEPEPGSAGPGDVLPIFESVEADPSPPR